MISTVRINIVGAEIVFRLSPIYEVLTFSLSQTRFDNKAASCVHFKIICPTPGYSFWGFVGRCYGGAVQQVHYITYLLACLPGAPSHQAPAWVDTYGGTLPVRSCIHTG